MTTPEKQIDYKEMARLIDPDCWASYSGRDELFRQAMNARRSSSLEKARKHYVNTCKDT